MGVRFSLQDSIEHFLETHYSDPEELKIIRETFERLRDKCCAQTTPVENSPELIVATGSSGAGKTTFLKELCEEPDSNRILIDADTIRDNLPLFTDTIEKHRDEGMSLREADKIAFGKYRRASLYIFHSLINHFCENDYNVMITFMPESILNGVSNMVEKAQEYGHCSSIIMFNAPSHELLEGIIEREKETGRAANPDRIKEAHQCLSSCALSLLEASFPCQFYWRDRYDEAPVLALNKDEEGSTTIEDEEAYEGLINNMPAVERNDFMLEVDNRSLDGNVAIPALD